MLEVKIEATRSFHQPYFVYTKTINALWRKDSFFVEEWEGEPKTAWFRWSFSKKVRILEAFYTADAHIVKDNFGYFLHFTNGRHRTRWLLQMNMPIIPIGISDDNILLAYELGVISKKVSANDTLTF